MKTRLLTAVSLWLTLSAASSASEWRQLVPASRNAYSIAYDSGRREIVMFGGMGSGILSDTWVWNGTTWTQRLTDGPTPRHSHAMAYDTARGKIVLFGGNDGRTMKGDTWTWDGSRWSLVSESGPSPRMGHSMAYDAARGLVVLFSGVAPETSFADTWLWDGSRWTNASSSGPSARRDGAMVYDAARREVILFGGSIRGTSDTTWTWAWDGTNWAPRANTGPPATEHPLLAYDEATSEAVLFHQFPSDPVTWSWNGRSWTRKAVTGPRFGFDAAIAWFGPAKRVLAFGPARDGRQLQVWSWEASEWKQIWVNGPGVRFRPGLAHHDASGKLVLFGGRSTDFDGSKEFFHSDTWLWDGVQWKLSEATGPAARYNHAMAYDERRRQIVLYGGQDGKTAFRDTWLWDGSVWSKAADSGPTIAVYGGAVSTYSMAYDAARGLVTLATRYRSDDGRYPTETWVWTGSAWEKISDSCPNEITRGSLVFDGARKELLAFPVESGYTTISVLSDRGWQKKGDSLRRSNYGVFFDSTQGKVVLVGGVSGDNCPLDGYGARSCYETWLWDGSVWSQDVAAKAPSTAGSAYFAGTTVYDSARNVGFLWSEGTWAYYSVPPKPSVTSVVNGASFVPALSDGAWTAIFGNNLSVTSRSYGESDLVDEGLPLSMDGVSVTIDGQPAPLARVSPTQLNVLAPITGKTGPVTVTVTNNFNLSASVNVEMSRSAPGLFTFPAGNGKYPSAVIVSEDGGVEYLGPPGLLGEQATRPAKPGETIILQATGLGPTDPPAPAGHLFSGSAPCVDPVTVTIGGVDAPVSFAGMVSTGLFQIRVSVPAVAEGDQPLVVKVNGAASQPGLLVAVGP